VLSDSAVALVLRAPNGFAAALAGSLTYHRKLRQMRHHGLMELREGLSIDDARLAEFAAQHGIRRLALFGSALRPDFASNSDIDLLVEFLPGRTPGLLRLAAMELELEAELGYPVELRTYEDLSTYFRHQVAATSRPLYAA